MKSQHITPNDSTPIKAEQRYLEGFLKDGDKPLYILAVLRANIPESTISELEKTYQDNNDIIGVTGLLDTVVIVAKNTIKVKDVAEHLKLMTGKCVGILEYSEEEGLTKIYSDIFNAAEMAEKELKSHRIYERKKDSLEGKLGISGH